MQFALYLAILADVCASIPTVKFVWKRPDRDRPFAWVIFALGYGFAIFAITEHTFANYILPIWMFAAGLAISLPLVLYRLNIRARVGDWI